MMRCCARCGDPFVAKTTRHRFCSRDCKDAEYDDGKLGVFAKKNEPLTNYRTIGEALGLSRSRAEQICNEALEKLRAAADREDWF